MKIINSFLTKNLCYVYQTKIVVKGLMLHSVGCPQPSAQVFARLWDTPALYKCTHAVIDGNSGDVYQFLPWNYKGWHCGETGNSNYIGVEMGEPNTIKYSKGSNWVEISDGENTKETIIRTYKSAVELFAYLCNMYNLDPLKEDVILSHSEGHKIGIASNHGDVEHIWNKFGLTMNQFRKDVANALLDYKLFDNVEQPNKIIYRVQVGSFSYEKNANALSVELKNKGFLNVIVKTDKFFRVQTGAFTLRPNAEAMKKKLIDAGYVNAFITF